MSQFKITERVSFTFCGKFPISQCHYLFFEVRSVFLWYSNGGIIYNQMTYQWRAHRMVQSLKILEKYAIIQSAMTTDKFSGHQTYTKLHCPTTITFQALSVYNRLTWNSLFLWGANFPTCISVSLTFIIHWFFCICCQHFFLLKIIV